MKTTAKYRTVKPKSTKVTVPGFIDSFYQFSKKQQSVIIHRLNEASFPQQWRLLDKSLPDLKITDEEIMKEVKAVRNGR